MRDHIGLKIQSFQSEAQAETFIKKLEEHRQQKGTSIHTLEVPEQMKKQIKAKGFPLYSKTLQDTMAGLQRMA